MKKIIKLVRKYKKKKVCYFIENIFQKARANHILDAHIY